LSEIIFSLIGVLLGFAIFGMEISILMTGVGIVALAGIVVRNGILIVEFIDLMREQGMELKEAIIEGGKTRMTPVLLTATATIPRTGSACSRFEHRLCQAIHGIQSAHLFRW